MTEVTRKRDCSQTVFHRLARAPGGTCVLLALMLCGAPSLWADQEILRLDPAGTRIEFLLDAGLHNVEGTAELSRGEIRFDRATGEASGEIVADATSAETDGKKRDKKMHKAVLESAAYPEIIFQPKRIEGTLPQDGESDIRILGTFELHGTAHEVVMPVHVEMSNGMVSGTATLNVPYVAWGLKDPSVFILRVHKDVDVTLQFAGTLEPAVAGGSPRIPAERQASH